MPRIIASSLRGMPSNHEQNAGHQQDIHPIEAPPPPPPPPLPATPVGLLLAAVTVSVADAGAALLPAGPVTSALAGMLAV